MTAYVFGQKKQRVSIVLYEEFTGDGSDVTFQLTSSPANATWLATHGAWAAGNIHTTYPAHITKTNKKPIYDSIIPLTRNRIAVSSISAGGLVTLDYAPRSAADFYVWYWYQLSTDDILSAYYRADFIASMEGEMIGTVSLYDTDSSNVLTMAWNEDDDTDRILNLILGGADRTITLSGNPTLADWFDQAVKAASNVNFGTIGCGEITVVDGSSINLQEALTFTGATTENLIEMLSNLADALSIQEGANKYITFITTTGDEEILFSKHMRLIHTATAADDHALEIDANAANFGDIKALDINYITGTIGLGQDEGIILINIDESQATTGADVFALEVLATEGSADIYGLKAGALVGPIHQDSGTFTDMDSALVKAVNSLTAFTTSDPGEANNVEMFLANGDTVTIGDAAKFEELEFLLETVASGGGIKPTFHFSTGVGAWTAFTPTDGTDGMRHTGVIAWDDADIPTWALSGGEYLIRITRTRQVLTTPPKEDKVQISAVTEYTWDKNGDVSIRGLTLAGNLVIPDAGNIGSTSDTDAIAISAAGILDFTGQSGMGMYFSADYDIPNTAWVILPFDTEEDDIQNEFAATITGTADQNEANKLHDADGGFDALMAGAFVYNSTDLIWGYVTAFVDATELTLAADTFPDGNENYTLYKSRCTVIATGKYLASIFYRFAEGFNDQNEIFLSVTKNGVHYCITTNAVSGGPVPGGGITLRMALTASDNIVIKMYHNFPGYRQIDASYCRWSIAKLS